MSQIAIVHAVCAEHRQNVFITKAERASDHVSDSPLQHCVSVELELLEFTSRGVMNHTEMLANESLGTQAKLHNRVLNVALHTSTEWLSWDTWAFVASLWCEYCGGGGGGGGGGSF